MCVGVCVVCVWYLYGVCSAWRGCIWCGGVWGVCVVCVGSCGMVCGGNGRYMSVYSVGVVVCMGVCECHLYVGGVWCGV